MSKYKYKILQKHVPIESFLVIEKETMKFCGSASTFEDAQWKATWNAMEKSGDFLIVSVAAIVNSDVFQKKGDDKPSKHLVFRHFLGSKIYELAGKKPVLKYLEDSLSRLIHRKKISEHVDELIRSPEQKDAIN